MRVLSFQAAAPLLLACAILNTTGCSDSLPTEAIKAAAPEDFSLTEAAAQSLAVALADVQERVLPTFSAPDALSALGPLLEEMSSSLNARDARALRTSLARINSALS